MMLSRFGQGPEERKLDKELDAKTLSLARRAAAYLDAKQSFTWTPTAGMRAASREEGIHLELGVLASTATDHWSEIDKRMAEAVWQTGTFADFLGLPRA
jgi:hypothetical protein